MDESKAQRLQKISLASLGAALLCLCAIPAGWALLPESKGLKGLGPIILMAVAGVIPAALFGIGSLVSGTLCARQRKHVLLWVVPLWVGAAWAGIAFLILYVLLPIGHKLGLIRAGDQDDALAILSIWLGGSALIGISLWIKNIFSMRNVKYAPWWSVPLWGILLLAFAFVILD